ncbi:Syntaxin-6 [Chelonia mydas]|uniref:Syntaxin-6 n=1 Tax=Chelonia mydas TaxID=8469 RepID=M7BBC9_CHEMY|nr:Syntaxin-6 [Chelonia mydas]
MSVCGEGRSEVLLLPVIDTFGRQLLICLGTYKMLSASSLERREEKRREERRGEKGKEHKEQLASDGPTGHVQGNKKVEEASPRDSLQLLLLWAFCSSTSLLSKEQRETCERSCVGANKRSKALLGESGGQSWSSGSDKYGGLDRELQLANSHFIEEQQAQQQLIVEQQDEQLELVSGSIGVLKNMSQRIGGELEEQAVMLDDFSHELDNTQSRLDNVMKKLAKVSHMTSG